jgi:hypothetical protein
MTHQRNAVTTALKIEKGTSMREPRIFAYGFDAAGFSTHRDPVFLLNVGQIEFIDFFNPISFEMADGVIIPQGIFERIERQPSNFGAKTTVAVDKASMLERERQLFDCLRDGKWVCFLVGEIIDELPQGFHTEPINDTDLCKRVLNAFQVGRHRQLFFLPFQTKEKSWPTALSVAKMVAGAIVSYRRSRISDIPDWVDQLRFRSEEDLYLEINSLLEQVNRLQSQARSWRDYKGILTTSGSQLRNRIVAILESVFGFHVEVAADHKSAVITETITVQSSFSKALARIKVSTRISSTRFICTGKARVFQSLCAQFYSSITTWLQAIFVRGLKKESPKIW